MQIISIVLCALSFLSMTASSLVKGKDVKKILFLVFLANFLVAVSYLITGAVNGAAACLVGAGMSIINFFFTSKGKKIPNWLSAIYIVVITAVNIAVADGISIPVILVIIAGFVFVMSVGVENGKKYRFWTAINLALWVIYDILLMTWGPFAQHALQLITTIIGIVTFDIKKQAVQESK